MANLALKHYFGWPSSYVLTFRPNNQREIHILRKYVVGTFLAKYFFFFVRKFLSSLL